MRESRDYFMNPCCYGDDVAKWLIRELQKVGVKSDETPGQEDFGWYLNFEVSGICHSFVLGHRPDNEEDEAGIWIGWIERRGFMRSLLGRCTKDIQLSAAEAIHRILSSSSLVQDVRWHLPADFDKGHEVGEPSPRERPERM